MTTILQILAMALGVAAGLAALGFWFWMLIDCLRHENRSGEDRIVWLIVIVATKLIGALVYYFVRRPDEWGQEGPPDPEPNPANDIIVDTFPELAEALGA